MADLKLQYVALTDVGLRRSSNQDSGFASSRFIAVADGMGGAAAGDLASSQAMDVVREMADYDGDDALTALETIVHRANQRLGECIQADPAVEGMGTTLEAMFWDGDKFATAHIGDSRAYLLRDGELQQISTDHTFVQSLVDEGKLTLAEARVHPHRSLLLRVMLGRDDNDPDLAWFEGQVGDRYLLCSDGLSDMISFEAIARNLALDTIDLAATELVRLALDAGGYDNVTVVIGELVDADTDPGDLSCADGRPHLVGAAAEGPRAKGESGGSAPDRVAATDPDALNPADIPGAPPTKAPTLPPDPEELRYAPRPPSRLRTVRSLIVGAIVLAIVAGGLFAAWSWSQEQYYVAADGDSVAIFKGVEADLPLVTLSHVEQVTDISLEDLGTFRARQVRDGIAANSLLDAREIVEGLREQAVRGNPTPTPTPTPSSTLSPTPTPTRTATA